MLPEQSLLLCLYDFDAPHISETLLLYFPLLLSLLLAKLAELDLPKTLYFSFMLLFLHPSLLPHHLLQFLCLGQFLQHPHTKLLLQIYLLLLLLLLQLLLLLFCLPQHLPKQLLLCLLLSFPSLELFFSLKLIVLHPNLLQLFFLSRSLLLYCLEFEINCLFLFFLPFVLHFLVPISLIKSSLVLIYPFDFHFIGLNSPYPHFLLNLILLSHGLIVLLFFQSLFFYLTSIFLSQSLYLLPSSLLFALILHSCLSLSLKLIPHLYLQLPTIMKFLPFPFKLLLLPLQCFLAILSKQSGFDVTLFDPIFHIADTLFSDLLGHSLDHIGSFNLFPHLEDIGIVDEDLVDLGLFEIVLSLHPLQLFSELLVGELSVHSNVQVKVYNKSNGPAPACFFLLIVLEHPSGLSLQPLVLLQANPNYQEEHDYQDHDYACTYAEVFLSRVVLLQHLQKHILYHLTCLHPLLHPLPPYLPQSLFLLCQIRAAPVDMYIEYLDDGLR